MYIHTQTATKEYSCSELWKIFFNPQTSCCNALLVSTNSKDPKLQRKRMKKKSCIQHLYMFKKTVTPYAQFHAIWPRLPYTNKQTCYSFLLTDIYSLSHFTYLFRLLFSNSVINLAYASTNIFVMLIRIMKDLRGLKEGNRKK